MIGRTVSHYRVQERLGGGGMGVVYRAEDTRLHRPVALKFLPGELTQNVDARARFIQEARAASLLEHPNICTVYDVGETPDGESFICMAYCDGETLKRRLLGGPLPLAAAVGIAEQVCAGLAKAHAHGIVHRDIKPANLMVTVDGTVKIVDFGLAKLAGTATLTGTGVMVGTAAYVAPEQARGAAVDHRADLWSLGVVLYEMVTGRLPFRAEHVQALLLAVVHDSEPAVALLRPETPTELSRVIHKCLRKSPAERYQSADELRADLARIHAALDSGAEPTISASTLAGAPAARRRRLALGAAAALALAALAAVGVLWRARPRTGVLPADRHVAILPLTNVGGDPGSQAFCDGLAETLTSALTHLAQSQSGLWVVPASEVRGRRVDSAEAARRAFGVNLAVSGSAQRDRDSVRVTLNLVDTASLRQLSSAILDERRDRLAALQDGAVGELAAMLGLAGNGRTGVAAARAGTTTAGAYEAWVEGRGALQRYDREENVEAAIASFTVALAADPAYAPAHAGFAEACFRMWNARRDPQWVAKAEAACARALALDRDLGAAHATLGMIRNGTGRYEEAVAALRRAIELEPGNTDAYRELALAQAALGRVADAEATYRRAIALDPALWVSHNTLGVFYWEQGRYREAAAQFQRVIELLPGSHWGYNNLGGLYLYLGEPDKARAAFARSLAAEPNYAAYANLGTIVFQAGDYDEAAALYRKALALDSGDYVIWGNLAAACRWGGGDREAARGHYQRAAAMAAARLEVNPRDPAVLSDLAAYEAELGHAARAGELLERALAAAPDDPQVLFQAGVTRERLGDRRRALELLGRALARGQPRDEVTRAPDLAALRADRAFAALSATTTPAR